jgi:rhodanese-related sulfurtransferase
MSGPAIKTITCRDLHDLSSRQPIELIDVRTPEEFREVRATGARNVPLDSRELLEMSQRTNQTADPTLYFICAVGGRSAQACAAFMAAGHPNVVNVEGGTQAWFEAGLPAVSGE